MDSSSIATVCSNLMIGSQISYYLCSWTDHSLQTIG